MDKMKGVASHLLSKIRGSLSRAKLSPVRTASVRVIPDEWLFEESLPLPEGVPEKAWPELVRLHLESLSPFPLHQLVWGFFRNGETARLEIFAALRDRLKQAGLEPSDPAQSIFPLRIALAGLALPESSTLAILGGSMLFIIRTAEGGSPPECLNAAPMPQDSASDPVALLQELLPEETNPDEVRLWKLNGQGSTRSDASTFTFTETGWDGPLSETGKSGRIWTPRELDRASLRDEELKQHLARSEDRGNWVIRALALAAVLMLLAGILQVLAGWQQHRGNRLEDRLASNRERVIELEERHRLREQLSNLLAHEPGTFALLEHINSFRQPGVHFNRVEFRQTRLTIDAETRSVEQVNEFVRNLREAPSIQSVELSNQITRVTGDVSFTLTLVGTVPNTQTGILTGLALQPAERPLR